MQLLLVLTGTTVSYCWEINWYMVEQSTQTWEKRGLLHAFVSCTLVVAVVDPKFFDLRQLMYWAYLAGFCQIFWSVHQKFRPWSVCKYWNTKVGNKLLNQDVGYSCSFHVSQCLIPFGEITSEMIIIMGRAWASSKHRLLIYYLVMAHSKMCHCWLFKPNLITHE